MNFDFGGMPHQLPHSGNFHGLPKLNTQLHGGDMSNSLRTAPPTTDFGGFDADHLFNPHHTINPAALHANDVVPVPSNMPFGFDPNLAQHMPPGDDFSWMRDWNMQHMAGGHDNDPDVFEESSPSRISSGDSPAEFNDSLNNSHANLPIDFQWPPAEGPVQQPLSSPGFQADMLGSGFSHLGGMGETVSPSHLHPSASGGDAYFQQRMMHAAGQSHLHPNVQSQQHMHHLQQQHLQQQQAHMDNMQNQAASVFGHPLSQFDSNSPSMSAASLNGSGMSARKGSMTTMSADSITESTRQALLNTLSQPSVYGGHLYRKYSQPSVSSPLSGGGRPALQSTGPNLPSTADIRRYIEAFIQYAHPHLPVVHYASLSFDSIENTVNRASSPGVNMGKENNVGGAKCLILSMAAIGALYEYDHPASKELFDAAKKMIALYLEDKRKNEMSSRRAGAQSGPEALPPLWLVQAILLNVIYGHHCGDKLAAEVASQHISSLIGLMRAAKVTESMSADTDLSADAEGGEDGHPLARHPTQDAYLHAQWIKWKTKEERKRCFLAMYFVSSLLLIGYNQTPAIMNSEIHLCLPCEENLYNAESAQEWQNLGGLAAAQSQEIPFAHALNHLLSAGQRQSSGQQPESELKPSTYGCLILICALHNVIWETRNRQADTDCTAQQMEDMISNIAPALKAWQAAWKANERHCIERPNPFGLGPLAADCIPLLDLAFVRLYVDLGPTQEAFRERDFDRMANELASRTEALHFQNDTKSDDGKGTAKQNASSQPVQASMDDAIVRREKHLRRAAFYAADSLTVACQYNLTYADQSAHELPIQSAVGFLACVQVLSEWVSAVQERVGPQLGMLGRDAIDFSQMPAIALLEAEDLDLLHKMDDICHRLEQKRLAQENLLAVEMNNFNPSSTGINPGRNKVDLSRYGSAGKLTRVIAMMLEKAVIWPITHVIAQALEVEAQYLDRRAAASLTAN